jgi:hypothetical protein
VRHTPTCFGKFGHRVGNAFALYLQLRLRQGSHDREDHRTHRGVGVHVSPTQVQHPQPSTPPQRPGNDQHVCIGQLTSGPGRPTRQCRGSAIARHAMLTQMPLPGGGGAAVAPPDLGRGAMPITTRPWRTHRLGTTPTRRKTTGTGGLRREPHGDGPAPAPAAQALTERGHGGGALPGRGKAEAEEIRAIRVAPLAMRNTRG